MVPTFDTFEWLCVHWFNCVKVVIPWHLILYLLKGLKKKMFVDYVTIIIYILNFSIYFPWGTLCNKLFLDNPRFQDTYLFTEKKFDVVHNSKLYFYITLQIHLCLCIKYLHNKIRKIKNCQIWRPQCLNNSVL